MLLRRMTENVKAQNWFAVALDFVIVVIGVGVAMLSQQWLYDHQQRADMIRAESALQNDLFATYFVAKERLAVTACRHGAYRAIADKLLAPGEHWQGMPHEQNEAVFKNALPTLLRSPVRSWGSRIWKAELARGTFNQMDDNRRSLLDAIFTQADDVEVIQDDIFTLQGRMKILAVSTTIGQSDRLKYYDVLAELDEKSGLLEIMSGQLVANIEVAGIDLDSEDRKQIRDNLTVANERGRTIYGDCFTPMEWPVLNDPTDTVGAK